MEALSSSKEPVLDGGNGAAHTLLDMPKLPDMPVTPVIQEGAGPGQDEDSQSRTAPQLSQLMQDDDCDGVLSCLLALRRTPLIGWFNATGYTARELRPLSRSPEMQRLRLSLTEAELVSPRLLHTLYRQKLLAQLQKSTDLTSLNTIGRLLEKVQLPSAADAAAQEDSALQDGERLCRRLELLLERFAASHELLGEAQPAEQGRRQHA